MSLMVDIRKKLGGFSLDIAFETDGSVLGLLGASGSGKSMALKCIAGIARPDCGRIVLNGVTLFDSDRKVNLPPQQRRVGYLFQNYALFPTMTVRQNILCSLRGSRDNAANAQILEDMLSLLHLEGLENRRPNQLSGGQQQRVALARILVSRPSLLMLDEPFSALDSHLRDQLQVGMKQLLTHFDGDAILVTHNRDEAYHLCGQIAVVEDGSLLTLKETDTLFENPESCQAAFLTGCQNVVTAAKKISDHAVAIPAWGVCLTTAQSVRDDLCAVGIHAHAFDPTISENRFPVRITCEMGTPFESVLRFRYEQQDAHAPDLWWRCSGKRIGDLPAALGVSPAWVLPLYQ